MNLTNGVRYRFFVRAENPAGPSEASAPAEAVLLTVAYSASSYEATEGGAAVEVGVVLSPATDRAVSIPLTVTAEAGTEASDYTVGGLSQGTEAGAYTVSFTPGQSIQTFTITANVDEDEDDETVSLGLGPLPSGVRAGTPASATVTLLDVQLPEVVLTVAYSASSYEATEGGAAVEVGVVLSPPTDRAVSLPLTVTAEAGTEASDYTVGGLSQGTEAGAYTVSFTSGESIQTFTITANVDEDDETVSLGLGPLPEGVSAGTPASATVTLLDVQLPEVVLTVAYSASSYEATEGGAAVEVGVVLSPAADRAVSIPLTVTADAGTEESDYTVGGLTQGTEADAYTVSFASGQSSRTFTITANEDADRDDETVSLGLGTLPEGVSAGTPASATVTLLDVPNPPVLTATAGNEQVLLGWDDLNDDSVTEWQYRGDRHHPTKDVWTGFRDWTTIPGSNAGTTSYTVPNLTNGVRYRFNVRAKNRAGPGRASNEAEAVLLTVAYSASSYEATEGGAAVEVGVVLSPAADRAVSIPLTVTADAGTEESDYTVRGLSGGTVSFTRGQSTQTFTITANVDEDEDDETVSLGLGTLPEGVSAGTPASATVTLLDVPNPPVLTATAGNEQALLEWNDLNDATVTEWQYRGDRHYPTKDVWTGFRDWTTIPGSNAGTTSYTVPNLTNGVRYRFNVRAKNRAGPGRASNEAEAVLLTVAYSASSYEATEGGAAVEVGVVLSPAADRAVSIPLTVTAEAGTEASDYTVGGLSQGTVSFTPGESTQSFTITANADADADDETVSLGLGPLPEGVRAGTLASATVTLLDVPDQPQNLTATAGAGQVTLRWDALHDTTVTEWQYRGDRYYPTKDVWTGFQDWMGIADSDSTTTSHTVTGLSNGVRYRFSVRAENPAGPSEASATAEAVLLTAAYSASSYQATEGGAAVSVGVVLSPATDRAVSIPIRVTADAGTEGGDYTVGGLSGGRLSFTSGQSTRTFTIAANVDGDGADETVSLGLGSLPSGGECGHAGECDGDPAGRGGRAGSADGSDRNGGQWAGVVALECLERRDRDPVAISGGALPGRVDRVPELDGDFGQQRRDDPLHGGEPD